MLAKELISNEIPFLKTTDSGERALEWMEEFKVSHLPVIDGENYLGLISETELLSAENLNAPIGDRIYGFNRVFVRENQHIYDTIRLFSDHKLSVVPVLTTEETYGGVISVAALIQSIGEVTSINSEGSIVVLEIPTQDYTLSQVSQIVEGNNAKILSAFITNKPNPEVVELTLKINKSDLSGILQTFHRYEYKVTESFQETAYQERLNDRYEELMKYLDI